MSSPDTTTHKTTKPVAEPTGLNEQELRHVFNMNACATNFLKSEIVRNKYVWYAIGMCVLILVTTYEIPTVRQTLSLFPLSIFEWFIIVVFSFAGMMINQLARFAKIIKP
jgi:Ca2+-transporting ATPase